MKHTGTNPERERTPYETPEITKLGRVEVLTRNVLDPGTGDTFVSGLGPLSCCLSPS